jgi:hypothetical protein
VVRIWYFGTAELRLLMTCTHELQAVRAASVSSIRPECARDSRQAQGLAQSKHVAKCLFCGPCEHVAGVSHGGVGWHFQKGMHVPGICPCDC